MSGPGAPVATPVWAVGHPWALHQLDVLTERWAKGTAHPCPHRQVPADGGGAIFVPSSADVICALPGHLTLCGMRVVAGLPARLARPRRCDGCGKTARLEPAFAAHPVRPGDLVLAVLCPPCLAAGPPASPSTRDVGWATESRWVAERTVEAVSAWARGDLTTCEHRHEFDFNEMAGTVFDVADGTARCVACEAIAPAPAVLDRRCDGCGAAALFNARLVHDESPEYVLLAAMCETCAPGGPVMSGD